MLIPADVGNVRISVQAADILVPFPLVPPPSPTGQTQVVWNLQVTPVPWAGTLALLAVGLLGIAFARRSKLSDKGF